MPTIYECFETEHSHCINQRKKAHVALSESDTDYEEIDVRVHCDPIANSRYVSIFALTPKALIATLDALKNNTIGALLEPIGVGTLPALSSRSPNGISMQVENINGKLNFQYTEPGSMAIRSDALVFTGRILIYSPFDIDIPSQNDWYVHLQEKGVSISFRGLKYANSINAKPLGFISHDSRDKDDIARPIAERLRDMGLYIWYDEFTLSPGDSLRESIEKGLRHSQRCILILSPNFLSKGGWVRREYDSVYTRELIEEKKIFIPIWHNVSRTDVFEFSPMLADRVGLKWEHGIDQVCTKLFNVLTSTGD
jgi:TIR domain